MHNTKTEITVIDALMGTGKTSYVIDMINAEAFRQQFEDDGRRFIYITPTLSEVDRIKAACSTLQFRDPQAVDGSKLRHFNQLIEEGANIASTHKLFSMIDQKTRERLEAASYTLVIDEETECVREFEIKRDDIRALFNSKMVYTDEKSRIRWNDADWPDYDGSFEEIKALCDNGSLIRVNDSFWVWEFPTEFLKLFKRVYVLTYLFEGSLLSTYLRANDMPYITKTLSDTRELVDLDEEREREVLSHLRELVSVIEDDKLNAMGCPVGKENPMSANWYERDQKLGGKKMKKIREATYNFFHHRVRGKTGENMWSSFKDHSKDLRGKGYAKGWTPCNLRATNDFIDRKHLAYLVNVFIRPRLVQYFKACGVEPNEELYALSQLLQWMWRSQVRRGDPITAFIPSERMRQLFKDWVGGKIGRRPVVQQEGA